MHPVCLSLKSAINDLRFSFYSFKSKTLCRLFPFQKRFDVINPDRVAEPGRRVLNRLDVQQMFVMFFLPR